MKIEIKNACDNKLTIYLVNDVLQNHEQTRKSSWISVSRRTEYITRTVCRNG